MNLHLSAACSLIALSLLGALSACGEDSPSGASYGAPTEIIDLISAEVVPCETQDEPDTTIYSERAQTCFYTASDGVDDQMSAATYANDEQQEEAIPYLQELNPGATYVEGNGWTVRTSSDLADDVAKALDGQVVD